MDPPVGHVTFLTKGGQLDPPVGDVTRFEQMMVSWIPPVGHVTILDNQGGQSIQSRP